MVNKYLYINILENNLKNVLRVIDPFFSENRIFKFSIYKNYFNLMAKNFPGFYISHKGTKVGTENL